MTARDTPKNTCDTTTNSESYTLELHEKEL